MQAPLPAHSAERAPRQGGSRAVTPSRAGAARLSQHATGRHPRSRLQQGQDSPQVCGRRAAGGRLALQERLLRARRRCAPQSYRIREWLSGTRLLPERACMPVPVRTQGARCVRWATGGAARGVRHYLGQAESCGGVFAHSAATEQAGAVSHAGLRRTVACWRRGRGGAPPRSLRLGGALQQRCQLPSARLRARPGGRRNMVLHVGVGVSRFTAGKSKPQRRHAASSQHG